MGEARIRELQRWTDSPAQSGQRPIVRERATTSVAPLMQPRPLEDQWDDRYGLLPPEPPSSNHADSVMLALSDLDAPAPPTYGSLPGLPRTAQLQAQLKGQLNTALSFVGGYVDAVGFVALLGMFPSHLTGELVSLSARSTAQGARIAEQFLLVGLFLAGVVTSVGLARWLVRKAGSPYAWQLVLLGVSLFAFFIAGVGVPVSEREGSGFILVAGTAVFAMGIQNAIMRSALAGTLPTTVMTGNVTQLITEVMSWVSGRLDAPSDQEQAHQSMRRIAALARALGCFFSGALLGAWFTREAGLASVAVPFVLVASMTWHAVRIERRARNSVA